MDLYLAFILRDPAQCLAFGAFESLIWISLKDGSEFICLISSFPYVRAQHSEKRV